MNHPDIALGIDETTAVCVDPLIPLPQGVADLGRGEVRFENGSRADLSTRETELLTYLASHAGRVVSRDEILSQVWRLNPQRIHTRTIDMHVVHLRAKLGDDSRAPNLLHTVRGEGYLFSLNGRSAEKPVAAI
jgi:DNA-binding response OmpR family regulator